MYFNRYTPATKSQNLETARAQMVYNAVSRFCGKAEPRAKDYYNYLVCTKIKRGASTLGLAKGFERLGDFAHAEELRAEVNKAVAALDVLPWAEIVELVRNQGQSLRGQHVVYFSIISGGVKPGETKDIVQRYSTINRATPVQKMWYMEVANKEQAQAAEHVLHNIFDHARCMNRCQNKKDYYECNEEQAQKFIAANAHNIHKAIMEAIEGIE